MTQKASWLVARFQEETAQEGAGDREGGGEDREGDRELGEGIWEGGGGGGGQVTLRRGEGVGGAGARRPQAPAQTQLREWPRPHSNATDRYSGLRLGRGAGSPARRAGCGRTRTAASPDPSEAGTRTEKKDKTGKMRTGEGASKPLGL